MGASDAETYVPRSRALDLSGIAWDDVPRHPLPAAAVRALRYMQDIESHTIIGYQRLAATAGHAVPTELLERIILDESRHFAFYYGQAQQRLTRPGAARVARFLVDRFWAPVGTGVQLPEETRALARYLLSGPDGLAAARRIDTTIRKLLGFADVTLADAWMQREVSGAAA